MIDWEGKCMRYNRGWARALVAVLLMSAVGYVAALEKTNCSRNTNIVRSCGDVKHKGKCEISKVRRQWSGVQGQGCGDDEGDDFCNHPCKHAEGKCRMANAVCRTHGTTDDGKHIN